MFDSLDDQMKKDEEISTTKKERYIKYAVVAVSSLVLFGGLYLGISLFNN